MRYLKKTAAGAATVGAFALGAAGFVGGVAQAQPFDPGHICPGPGVNCVVPGNPLPPGLNGAPPPGHLKNVRWIPPVPDAPELPVVWNDDLDQWGVEWGGQFYVYTP
ncbi:hypothetical protein [Mycolicibacterium litorale]|uniref:Secreted protein n=1 Tax=Mycolicibacterium litorale TaxID=758802 RepID=A0AAD1MT27_9MYCO|nr:hypothetical protein [Mycolicibacterium litorale]MCV7418704.1 hypothetical protein [Mycolicibacterium litorale]TDY05898.1 hypothetical protein BCL50_2206 [Mycolicibacterium litorale]BBY14596.1 hypothetical protein MLIT_01880 [Mycolicibacterium litorale]